MASGFDFTKLGTVKFETNSHEITDTVNSIQIITTEANTVFLPTDDSVCKVVCMEAENACHSISVEDGCLKVRLVDEKKWYEHIGFQFITPKLSIYLPRGLYEAVSIDINTGNVDIPMDFSFGSVDVSGNTGDVTVLSSASEMIRIKTTTGNITVSDTMASSMELEVSTGRIKVSNMICTGDVKLHVSTGKTIITDLSCKNFTAVGKTGSLSLEQLIADEKVTIETTTGNVKFSDCDASTFFVKTSTGDVSGNLLSDKVFVYKTSSGKVDLPHTTSGGIFEVTTGTGNIQLKIGD